MVLMIRSSNIFTSIASVCTFILSTVTTTTTTHAFVAPSLSSTPIPTCLSSATRFSPTTNQTTASARDVDAIEPTTTLHELWRQKQNLDRFLLESPSTLTDPSSSSSSSSVTTATVSLLPTPVVEDIDDNDNTVWNARLLLLVAAALYGTNFSVVKLLGDAMPVGTSSTLRFGLASLATLPFLLQTPTTSYQSEEENRLSSLRAAGLGFEVGIWNSIGYLAQAVGLETTDASKSAFLCSMAVVIVPLLDFIAGRRLRPQELLGVLLAVTGVAFLELGDSVTALTDFSLSPGELASLFQPLAFGLGFWRMEQAMQRYPQEASRSTAAQLLAIFLASAVFAVTTSLPPTAAVWESWSWDPSVWLALFWTGVITTALTVYMETVALKTLSAAETTLILSTEPLWGAACASYLMHETFGLPAAIGGALVLAGCIVTTKR